jgi:hypothetical protein
MSLYLSANKLTSDYGTVGDYLIEWRLGSVSGDAVFITGEGSDPLLQAIHPFEDEIVQSGTLYPVIIYSDFNGQRYTLQPDSGDNYSPDLLQCLELYFVVIDSVNCASGGAGTYSHIYTYVNTLDPAIDASRTIKFDLNADGSTNFFAWYFQGFEVVDRLTIYYYHINDIENPDKLIDWKIGSNLTGDDFTSDPKKYDFSSIHSVIDLQPYNHENGDYLIIEVIPRTEEPTNLNTNWTLSVKCLETFDDNTYENNMRVIDTDTVAMIWDNVNCVYHVTWQNLVPYTIPTHYENYLDTRYLDYLEIAFVGFDYYTKNDFTFHVQLRNKIDTTKGSINYSTTCAALNGSLNITKTGNQLVYTFTNSTDYNFYKTSYNTILANTTWATQSTDPYVRSYYNHIFTNERIGTTCGDSYTDQSVYIWDAENQFVFDDGANTITITLTTFSLPIEEDCDDLYDETYVIKSNIDGAISAVDYSIDTNIRYNGFIGRYWEATNSIDSFKTFNLAYYEVNQSLIGITPTGWNNLSTEWYFTNGYGIDLQTGIVEITDMDDPINNFRIKTVLNPDGTYLATVDAIIVYEIANGVVIIPTTTTTTTTI